MTSVTSDSFVTAPIRSSRVDGIDAMRVMAFVAVVVLHSTPQGQQHGQAYSLISAATRFAVPFFFIVSGYFLSAAIPYTNLIWRSALRLAPVFIFWLVVYVLATGADFSWLTNPRMLAGYLVTGGPAFHLWYLPALGCALVIVGFLRGSPATMICVAAAFFLAGLMFGPYREVLSLPDLPIRTRNGPFFSVPFVATGYLLARSRIRPPAMVSAAIAFAGLALQIVEAYFVTQNGATGTFDFYVGTYLFGVGAFFLALQSERIPFHGFLASLGRVSLGMYCVHVLFLMMWRDQFDSRIPLELLTLVVLVVTLSAVTSLLASSAPFLRPLFK